MPAARLHGDVGVWPVESAASPAIGGEQHHGAAAVEQPERPGRRAAADRTFGTAAAALAAHHPSGRQRCADLQLRAGLSLEANPGMGVLCNSGSVITTRRLDGRPLHAGQPRRPGQSPVPAASAPSTACCRCSARAPSSPAASALAPRNARRRRSRADRQRCRRPAPARQPARPGLAPPSIRRNASLIGQVTLGTQSWVSIGGTLARVRLIPTEQLRGGLPPEWSSGSLSLGGGRRQFRRRNHRPDDRSPGPDPAATAPSAPASPGARRGRRELSVGADNIVTRGKNPFGLPDARDADNEDEGRVPYVRYQQDL